jgi:magnesium-transporting ATPase (P-type)
MDKLCTVIGFRDAGHKLAILADNSTDNSSLLFNYFNFGLKQCTESIQQKSDITLSENSLKTILEGIKMSRIMYDFIRSLFCLEATWIITLLVTSLVTAVFKGQAMISAVQIIWVSFPHSNQPLTF